MKGTDEKRFLELTKGKKVERLRGAANAVIYTRVSSKEQADNNASLDTQKRYCQEFAQKKEFNVMGFFGGTYESAKSDERKEFQRMLAFVKRTRKVSRIIVYSYDRFSRTGPNGAYISSQLDKLGVNIMAVTQEVDASTPSGAFQQNMYFMFSQFDNQTRRDRMMTGIKEKMLQGYWPLTVPLGYTNLNKGQTADKHHIVVDEKGKILRKAWQWKIKYGLSNKEIVQRLNKAGLKINERKLSDTFRNPFYCGKIVCKFIEGEVIEGKHEGMVSSEVFFKALDILKGRFEKGKHTKENSEQLPLRRFVLCSDCGEPYTGYLQKQKNLYYYRCRSNGCCKNRSRKILHGSFESLLKQYEVDADFADHVRKVMRYTFSQHNNSVDEELGTYRQNLKRVEGKIQQLEERFVEGEVSKDLFDRYTVKYEAERYEIATQLENGTISSSNLEKCVDWVVDMSQNLSNSWASSDSTQQLVLQKLLFPEGVTYDRDNDRFLTKRVNCLFLPIPLLTHGIANKKSGPKENFSLDPLKSG